MKSKHIVLFCCILTFIVAISVASASYSRKVIPSPEETLESPIMPVAAKNAPEGKDIFRNFIKMISSNESTDAMLKYLDDNRKKVDTKTYDQMFASFLCDFVEKENLTLTLPMDKYPKYNASSGKIKKEGNYKSRDELFSFKNYASPVFARYLSIIEESTLRGEFTHYVQYDQDGYLSVINETNSSVKDILPEDQPEQENKIKVKAILSLDKLIKENPDFILSKRIRVIIDQFAFNLLFGDLMRLSKPDLSATSTSNYQLVSTNLDSFVNENSVDKDSYLYGIISSFMEIVKKTDIYHTVSLIVNDPESNVKNMKDQINLLREREQYEILKSSPAAVAETKKNIELANAALKYYEKFRPYRQEYIKWLQTNLPQLNCAKGKELLQSKLSTFKNKHEISKGFPVNFPDFKETSLFNTTNTDIVFPYILYDWLLIEVDVANEEMTINILGNKTPLSEDALEKVIKKFREEEDRRKEINKVEKIDINDIEKAEPIVELNN